MGLWSHRLPGSTSYYLFNCDHGTLQPLAPWCPMVPQNPRILLNWRIKLVLPSNSEIHFIVWVALLVMYHSLYWVSHVIHSPHTLSRNDVKFHSWAVCIYVHSAKNLRHSPIVAHLPIVANLGSDVCPVHWLKKLFQNFNWGPLAPLFHSNRSCPISSSHLCLNPCV